MSIPRSLPLGLQAFSSVASITCTIKRPIPEVFWERAGKGDVWINKTGLSLKLKPVMTVSSFVQCGTGSVVRRCVGATQQPWLASSRAWLSQEGAFCSNSLLTMAYCHILKKRLSHACRQQTSACATLSTLIRLLPLLFLCLDVMLRCSFDFLDPGSPAKIKPCRITSELQNLQLVQCHLTNLCF